MYTSMYIYIDNYTDIKQKKQYAYFLRLFEKFVIKIV